ncbi:MAG: class I SAM-dependent methyltransferase [Ignavibacteriaceae bacterium]|nr:class I SAM-dependent methyltransferase [Ignavibacteriaceae bacterium]
MMGDLGNIKLGSVQKTLLLPLWGRAIETQKPKPLLIDNKAVSIIKSIPYDFTVISKNINKFVQFGWIARSLYFDKKINAFIDLYPEATIVNIGCGLDTTFDRVDNGKIQWIDLDLPDTIELRSNYISESDRRQFIPKSVLDTSWYKRIEKKNNVMLLIAGVLHYFDESDVKRLFNDFHTFLPGVEVIFDYASKLGMKISNKRVLKKGGMDKSAFIRWGIDNVLEIEKWNSSIKVLSDMPMYQEHKKNYSIMERVGMNIADALKMMSLAHIRIN